MEPSAIARALIAVAILSLLGAPSAPALADNAAAAPVAAPAAKPVFRIRSDAAQTSPSDPLPVYVPPRRGAPKDVAAAATRSGLGPRLKILAPDHVGLTVSERPTLYIYAQGPGTLQVQVSPSGPETGAKAIVAGRVELSSDRPVIRAVELGSAGGNLAIGTVYRIAATVFDRGGAVRSVDSAQIERIAEPIELGVMTAGATPMSRANAYASAGVWFDAIDAVSRAIDAATTTALARRGRAGLLDQAGLAEISGYDRKAMPPG